MTFVFFHAVMLVRSDETPGLLTISRRARSGERRGEGREGREGGEVRGDELDGKRKEMETEVLDRRSAWLTSFIRHSRTGPHHDHCHSNPNNNPPPFAI